MSTRTTERCVRAEAIGRGQTSRASSSAMLSARRNALTQMAASMPRRDADHPEQKEQGGEQEKTHQLFHPHHPGTRLRDEAEPGRLRA